MHIPPEAAQALREKIHEHHWTGGVNSDGYPKVKIEGKSYLASHVLLKMLGREVPPGKVVMHLDNDPKNLDPKNLRIGTQKQNLKQMRDEGRDRPRGVPQEPDVKQASTDMREPEIRDFLGRVRDDARERGLRIFAVADSPAGGASITVGQQHSSAVRNARRAHTRWEKRMGHDPEHDWSKEKMAMYQDDVNAWDVIRALRSHVKQAQLIPVLDPTYFPFFKWANVRQERYIDAETLSRIYNTEAPAVEWHTPAPAPTRPVPEAYTADRSRIGQVQPTAGLDPVVQARVNILARAQNMPPEVAHTLLSRSVPQGMSYQDHLGTLLTQQGLPFRKGDWQENIRAKNLASAAPQQAIIDAPPPAPKPPTPPPVQAAPNVPPPAPTPAPAPTPTTQVGKLQVPVAPPRPKPMGPPTPLRPVMPLTAPRVKMAALFAFLDPDYAW